MVTLLRILAILAAMKAVGTMIVMSGVHKAGEGPFVWGGRILDAGTTQVTLAVIALALAKLIDTKNNPNKIEY